MYQCINFGIPISKIIDDKRLSYPGIKIPSNFVIEDVLVKVSNPVKGKKIDVGIETDCDFLLKDIDVSTEGIVIPGKITDKKGKILQVTHGVGLCITHQEETENKSGKSKSMDIVYYEKIKNASLGEQTIYVTIPTGCSKEQPHGGLRVKLFIMGYQL